MYSLKNKKIRYKKMEKSYRDKHIAENHKILKKPFFITVRWYNVIHCCIKYEGFCIYT